MHLVMGRSIFVEYVPALVFGENGHDVGRISNIHQYKVSCPKTLIAQHPQSQLSASYHDAWENGRVR